MLELKQKERRRYTLNLLKVRKKYTFKDPIKLETKEALIVEATKRYLAGESAKEIAENLEMSISSCYEYIKRGRERGIV